MADVLLLMIYYRKSLRCEYVLKYRSVLLVADVLCLGGVKDQVADGSDQRIKSEGEVGKNEVSPRSGGESFGFERGMVDDNAADKSEEEGQQKADKVFVVHSKSP